MKKIFLLLLTIGMITSCSSDDDNSNTEDKVTSVAITLKKTTGEAVAGMMVYAYSEPTWDVIGDDPLFADFAVASDNNGVATFTDLTTATTFTEITNFTHTYRFSVHYSMDGTDKTKVKAISFGLGDDKTDTQILD
jgi:hypothetical protein